jgi:hypothetical protein
LRQADFDLSQPRRDADGSPIRRIYDLSRISLIFAASKAWVTGF